MSVHCGGDGTVRHIPKLISTIEGAARVFDTIFAGYGGVRRVIFKKYHWEKWDAKEGWSHREKISEKKQLAKSIGNVFDAYSSYNFSEHLGAFNLVSSSKGRVDLDMSNPFSVYMYDSHDGSTASMRRYTSVTRTSGYYYVYGYVYKAESYKVYSKGENLIEMVESDDPNMFPKNGMHTDGCWYVKI